MTDAAGAVVWRASYLPFGEVHSITGPASLDARFPGQWFMAETAFSYNWHRWYNSNLGRYTQPDPLGLADGPNRYAYAKNSPLMFTDPDGQQSTPIPGISPIPGLLPPIIFPGTPENDAWTDWATRQCRAAGDYIASLFEKDEGGEEERCRKVLDRCHRICNDTYVTDPEALPGVGTDRPGRYRRCIRECMQANGCFNY